MKNRPESRKAMLGTGKLPWGTIVEPDFQMGYQKLSEEEVNTVVERLNKIPPPKEMPINRPNKDMTQEEIDQMLSRLTDPNGRSYRVPENDRRVKSSSYDQMGVVSSYAWKGFN